MRPAIQMRAQLEPAAEHVLHVGVIDTHHIAELIGDELAGLPLPFRPAEPLPGIGMTARERAAAGFDLPASVEQNPVWRVGRAPSHFAMTAPASAAHS